MTDRDQIEKASKLIDAARKILARPVCTSKMVRVAHQKIDEAQKVQAAIKKRKDLVARAMELLKDSAI